MKIIHREDDIIRWSKDRHIIQNSSALAQSIKTLEEVTELVSGCHDNNKDEIRDAIGDVVVTLVNVAAISNLSMIECIEAAWNEIKDRKGYLNSQGIFVKEE